MHVKWANDKRIAVVWMNRKQTIMVISVCSEPNWECHDVCFRKYVIISLKNTFYNKK